MCSSDLNLDPSESRPGGTGGADGLLALWRKCPHLGCSVPWISSFDFNGDKGWYRCPCHGSTYTKAGVRVYGPAPRSMDTMKIEVDGAGNITVQTGQNLAINLTNGLPAGVPTSLTIVGQLGGGLGTPGGTTPSPNHSSAQDRKSTRLNSSH